MSSTIERITYNHPPRTIEDVAEGQAKVVRCPDCGQAEIWLEGELIDHGRCRTGQYPCACDEEE